MKNKSRRSFLKNSAIAMAGSGIYTSIPKNLYASTPPSDRINIGVIGVNWWVYPEAGTYEGRTEITNSNRSVASVEVPSNAAGKTIHIICEVRDKAGFPMTRYRRVVLKVK
jgi:hypothetical protein